MTKYNVEFTGEVVDEFVDMMDAFSKVARALNEFAEQSELNIQFKIEKIEVLKP